jgi:DUF3037 family protein
LSSKYVVFQYVPDAVTDERINFGVAAFGEEGLHARFLSNWRRVKSFGGENVGFLREFARHVEEMSSAQPSFLANADADVALLFETAPGWINTIQVTQARASTLPADALAEDVARRFLRTTVPRARARDRRWVRATAYRRVFSALESVGVHDPASVVRKQASVPGAIEPHEFDLVVENSHLVTAALTLSFERQNPSELQRDYASTAWALEDVRSHAPKLSLAVLMIPPSRGTSKTYDQARYVFDKLKARSVPEDEFRSWADEIAHAATASTH